MPESYRIEHDLSQVNQTISINTRSAKKDPMIESSQVARIQNLEEMIDNLQSENQNLNSYNEKLLIEAECLGTDSQAKSSFYQNMLINDLQKEVNSAREKMKQYKMQATELKSQVDSLKNENEYLNKLVNRYRLMVSQKAENEE